jgi:predicted transcriptional regulator
MSPVLTRLRTIREAKFLTQRELSAQSGVAEVTIARLEAGKVSARFSTTKKLAEALGVEPAQLVGE